MARYGARLSALEAAAKDAQLRQQAAESAAQTGEPLATVLADLRRIHAHVRWLDARYPPPRVGGLVDIEPNLRRLAAAYGFDPDEAVAEAGQIIADLDA